MHPNSIKKFNAAVFISMRLLLHTHTHTETQACNKSQPQWKEETVESTGQQWNLTPPTVEKCCLTTGSQLFWVQLMETPPLLVSNTLNKEYINIFRAGINYTF